MKKFDKGYIYHHLISDFFLILIAEAVIIGEMFGDDTGAPIDIVEILPILLVVFVVLYVGKTIYNFIYLNMSGYDLGETSIICNRGVLFKKHSVVDYTKMHAINKRQGLFQKIFHVATLTIDSGSANTAANAEVVIIERDDVVDKLVSFLKAKQKGEAVEMSEVLDKPVERPQVSTSTSAKPNLYSFSSKSKIIYSLLGALGTLFLVATAVIILGLVFAFINKYVTFYDILDPSQVIANPLVTILLMSLGVCVGVSALVFIIGIATSFLSWHDFTVYKDDDELEISYGLFVRNTNTLEISRIKALKVQSTIIQRMFGFGTVFLEVIGYCDTQEDSESNKQGENTAQGIGMLFPLIKANELAQVLAPILPEYTPASATTKPKYYAPFVLWRLFFVCFFTLLPLAIAVVDMILLGAVSDIVLTVVGITLSELAVVIGLILWGNAYAYRDSGVDITNNTLTVYAGAFTKYTTVIKRENIVAVDKRTTPLQEKKGIYSYTIHIFTNSHSNEVKVRCLDEAIGKRLEQFLIV